MNLANSVYEILKTIPKWKVISYRLLARFFCTSPRNIARILSKNTNQNEFPCYKVLASNWNISWYNLWVEEKIKRLESDWIIVVNWKVDKKYFLEKI